MAAPHTLGCKIAKGGKLLPFLFLYQSVGCLPDDALRQVFGENIILTSAILIQTVTAVVFNTLFGVQ
jgi:hypothetical protein